MKRKIPQKEFVFSYFKDRSGQEIQHQEVVDWATVEWERLTGKKFRDPDQSIRYLSLEGLLVKIRKGVYLYDPEAEKNTRILELTQKQKEEILKRGDYKCAVCGASKKEGIELHIDHIKPRERGGEATIENGQVLCASHNYRKKNFGQTESGKEMFINLLERAETVGDLEIVDFCNDVLKVYETHHINGHIEWRAGES